jgi:hypothetical protein
MKNGRCRMHGGRSTGARTQEGLAAMAKANTTHGTCTAASRSVSRYRRTLIVRMQLLCAAENLREYLPPELVAQLDSELGPHALKAPVHHTTERFLKTQAEAQRLDASRSLDPRTGRPEQGRGAQGRDAHGRFTARPRPALHGRALERQDAQAEAASLAPWRLAIAQARLAKRAARKARQAQPHAMRKQNPIHRGTVRDAAAHGRAERSRGLAGAAAVFLELRTRAADRERASMRGLPPRSHPSRGPLSRAGRTDTTGSGPPPPPASRPDSAADDNDLMQRGDGGGTEAASRARRDIYAMQRGTVQPGGTDRGAGAHLGQQAAFTAPEPSSIPASTPTSGSTTTPPASRPKNAADDNNPIHRGGGRGAEPASRARGNINPMPPLPPGACPRSGTAPPTEGPIRQRLMASTVSNTRDAHALSAQVQYAGGWPIVIAIDAAKQAGVDHLPAVEEAWQQLAWAALQRLTHRVLRPGSNADITRWHNLAGDPK